MGSVDKSIRLLIALALVGLYFMGIVSGTWGTVALVVAVVMALTSLVNFCPLYAVLGIKTTPRSKTT